MLSAVGGVERGSHANQLLERLREGAIVGESFNKESFLSHTEKDMP